MDVKDVFMFLRTIFTEIGTMQFISELECEHFLKIRGLAVDINKANILSIAIFTDLLSFDLSAYVS